MNIKNDSTTCSYPTIKKGGHSWGLFVVSSPFKNRRFGYIFGILWFPKVLDHTHVPPSFSRAVPVRTFSSENCVVLLISNLPSVDDRQGT